MIVVQSNELSFIFTFPDTNPGTRWTSADEGIIIFHEKRFMPEDKER